MYHHLDYGHYLRSAGRVDEAKAVYRQAVKHAEERIAHYPVSKEDGGVQTAHYLAFALMRDGSRLIDLNALGDAESAIRVSLGLFRQGIRENDPSSEWVRNCERLVEVDGKLSALLSGQRQPADSAECLGLAYLSQTYWNRYAAAVRFYRDAFSKEPRRADDLSTQDRYNAACAAALAGCGQGEDADKVDTKEHARLRQQALDWLRADLKAYRQMMEKSAGQAGPMIAQRMQHWLKDTDFAGVRGEEALAKLPESERRDWRELWASVAVLLAQTQEKAPSEKKLDTK